MMGSLGYFFFDLFFIFNFHYRGPTLPTGPRVRALPNGKAKWADCSSRSLLMRMLSGFASEDFGSGEKVGAFYLQGERKLFWFEWVGGFSDLRGASR
jgi:hypothetical protein